MPNKLPVSRVICIGGILVSIAAMFQSAPLFLPIAGLVLSPLSTLPLALAALIDIRLGVAVLFSSALILAFISPQEAVILLLTTGPLGIATGSMLHRRDKASAIFLSSFTLFTGMFFLTYVLGISAFGDLTDSLSKYLVLFIFFLFSFFYASLWVVGLEKIIKCLLRIKSFKSFFNHPKG